MTSGLTGWAFVIFASELALAPFASGQSQPAEASLTNTLAYCPGEYADDFSSLAPKTRELEQKLPAYAFCIRSTAIYECPFYGPDGNLRRRRRRVVAHGTGFAYKQDGSDTLLLTNQHVAEWPAVTDEEHSMEDVPLGCKRVSDTLKIVDNESDTYERDDIPLSRVVVDPQLDIAVVKAKSPLAISPWKIGHSAGLKERNVVDVRGFPLGVFKATNVGKVVSAYDHDDYKDWDHDDFVIDALLSPGNSGSPVFAISCKTGEFELVGVYHAGYTRGSALNVVVAIDQVRDLMTTLKRTPRTRPDTHIALDGASRAGLLAASKASPEPFFRFGQVTAAVRARDDRILIYELFSRDFPFRAYPVVVLEDLPAAIASDFGILGRVWIGNRQGLKAYVRADLDAETQSLLSKLLDALRGDSVASFAIRSGDEDRSAGKEGYERTARMEKALQRASASYADLAQNAFDLAERLGPQPGELTVTIRAVLQVPERKPDSPAATVATSPVSTRPAPPAAGTLFAAPDRQQPVSSSKQPQSFRSKPALFRSQ
jgi:serine protease Do